jgi:hypothetical protein
MADRDNLSFLWSNGFWPNTALIKGVPDCIVAGQNLWARGKGVFVSSRGFGSAVATSGGVNPLLNVGSGYGGLTGGGSVTQAFASGVYFFAGAGMLYVNGVPIGAVSGGTVTIYTGSAVVQAGLTSPGAPTIADSGAAGRNNGSYSIAVTAIRSITGGESTVSLSSNTISVGNHGIKITALPGFPAGADKVGIYVTKRGFGDIGPYFHLYDVLKSTVDAAIAGTGYVITIPGSSSPGWIDPQLGDLAPLDFNVPPACTHCFSINSVIVAAGCYGGAGLSASYPNKPEAYPVSFVLFIPGGGTITMVKGSGIEGAVLVGTASSLNLVTASQSTISPLNIRPIWPTTGVVSANQICTVGGEIFGWIGTRGPIRDALGSETDPGDEATAFAEPVMNLFATFGYGSGNVSVVYDGNNDTVWYLKGTTAIGYCRYLRQWHLPMTLPATIVTAVTDEVNNRALLSDTAGNLYTFENGSGSTWSMITQFQGSQGSTAYFPMTVIGVRAHVSALVRGDLYTNMNVITPNSQATNISYGANHGTSPHQNIQGVISVALGLSGSDAGGTQVWGADGLKILHPVRV